jgi:effector-binding domain-containing protein
MKYQCERIISEARPTMIIRKTTAVENLPQVLGEAFTALMSYLTKIGEYPVDAPFVTYYNQDMTQLKIDIGFPVSKQFPANGEIHPFDIPAGQYVVCLYTGPYEKMEPAYGEIMEWMSEQQYVASGIVYEFYLNGPDEVPSEKLQTRIMFGIK